MTFAHEYNHILQFGYDAYQDPWFAEATATWMEDQVYNGINDYLRYVRRWVKLWETPLTANSIKEYGSAVWNQWLARRYGPEIIRKAWAGAIDAKPGGFSVASYERALRSGGPSDFSHDFARFAAAVAEWRTGKRLPREPPLSRTCRGRGACRSTAPPLTRLLNHTTFQLLRVRPRRGRAVVVHLTAPRGTAAGLALVGRIGSERHGRPVSRLDYSAGGGRLTVRLRAARALQADHRGVVNADARAARLQRRQPRLELPDRRPAVRSQRPAGPLARRALRSARRRPGRRRWRRRPRPCASSPSASSWPGRCR